MATKKHAFSPKRPKGRKGELWQGVDDRSNAGGPRPHPEASRARYTCNANRKKK